MRSFLAARSRFMGTIHDLAAGLTITGFVMVVIVYLEAFAG